MLMCCGSISKLKSFGGLVVTLCMHASVENLVLDKKKQQQNGLNPGFETTNVATLTQKHLGIF